MERDFFKWSEYLAQNAREGIILERKIAEWKAEEKRKSEAQTPEAASQATPA